MIKIEAYQNLTERTQKVDLWENQGYQMLHDDFDASWKAGDEPHGTLTFTDEPGPTPKPIRNSLAEIDEINAKIADYDGLKARLEVLENE